VNIGRQEKVVEVEVKGGVQSEAMSFLMLTMALPGFRPFGQVLEQFMMVWQRYTEKGSCSLALLSLPNSS